MPSYNGSRTPQTQLEDEAPENDQLNFEKPDFSYIPKGNHVFRQEGPYLVCRGCELEHAVFIGMDKVMVGMDEKGPIIKKRSELR